MDKLKFETPDMVARNIEKIGALFPAAITEMRGEDGQIRKGINFEVLKQLLSRDVVDGDECYEFTWVGKKAAMAEAARPITKTLRPVKEDSRDWDTTQNLYIEGDNLEVLKILQESYLGKVKMIYIDPPYNTGHDFIYRDKFQRSQQEENEQMGMYDEDENQMFENTESNGRFHSDWCSMMYSRLVLARNLLSENGVIFISISDSEADNLKKICDEVFGAICFVANITWQNNYSPRNDADGIPYETDNILVYRKSLLWKPKRLPRTEEMNARYINPDNDVCCYKIIPAHAPGAATHKGMVYAIQQPVTGELLYPPVGRHWKDGQSAILKILNEWAPYELREIDDSNKRAEICNSTGDLPPVKAIMLSVPLEDAKKCALERYSRGSWPRYYFSSKCYGGIQTKGYLADASGRVVSTLWKNDEVGTNVEATNELKALFGGAVPFDTPKPVRLLDRIIAVSTDKDDIILDFFSGSATTAHAIMSQNAQDGGFRKYILVQIPEATASPQYKTLCEIGKERIRRAGDKIKADNPLGTQNLDIGFRVFRVDESNMKDVYYQPEELDQQSMFDLVSNIKDDRTDLDLLYACLLDWGVEIHLPHTSTDLDGCTVHNVDNGALMAYFSPNVPRSVVEYMAKQQPLRAVFRDSAFASDDAKINVTEIFKNLSPDTKVKVI